MQTRPWEVKTFRCPADLWEALMADLAKHNDGMGREHLSVTDWLHRAIRERLAHRARGRARRKPTKKGGGA